MIVVEQLVAPLDRCPQRPLPGVPWRAGGEQREPIVEPREDRGDREHPGASSGELDRQREAVEHPAHRRDLLGIGGVDREVPAHGPGPLGEQLHGLAGAEVVHRGARRWQAERRHGPQHLAGDAERLAAGREDADGRAHAQQVCRECGAGVEDVLAGVEDEQAGPVGEPGGERVHRVGERRQADGGGQLVRHVRRVGHLGELHQPHGALRALAVRHGEGQTGLAGAAWAGERDHAVPRDEVVELGDLLLSPDQTGGRRGEAWRGVLRGEPDRRR